MSRKLRKLNPVPKKQMAERPAVEPNVFADLADQFFHALGDATRDSLAKSLDVSTESLRRLRVGWSESHRAFTFPMQHADGNIVGVRPARAIDP